MLDDLAVVAGVGVLDVDDPPWPSLLYSIISCCSQSPLPRPQVSNLPP